jgi:nucleotide-binding universal stress UspA family protein
MFEDEKHASEGGLKVFEKILYPTDFSEHARKLVEAVGELKTAGLKEIVLAHVVDIRTASGMAVQFKKHAMEALAELGDKLEKKGLKVKIRVPIGVPFTEIVELAQKEKVSMIVMGSHGKGFAKQILLGSVSDNVLRNATVPVLIVRLDIIEKPGARVRLIYRKMLQKILCPTDFSDCAWKALRYVKRLGEAGAKEAVVMHVRDVRKNARRIMEKLPERDQIDLQVLKRVKGELKITGMRVKTVLVEGIPSAEIIKTAEKENASLIVMGSHGRTMLKEMAVGSVCAGVVRHTTKPILVIRRNTTG